MPKITIDVEDDEYELVKLIGETTDFYGDGFDDNKKPGERESGDIWEGFMDKLKKAMKK